jgi:hypothetical protein
MMGPSQSQSGMSTSVRVLGQEDEHWLEVA